MAFGLTRGKRDRSGARIACRVRGPGRLAMMLYAAPGIVLHVFVPVSFHAQERSDVMLWRLHYPQHGSKYSVSAAGLA